MTDGFDQALADAGLNLLRADLGPPALAVFDGKVDEDPVTGLSADPPYVLVYTTVEWPPGAPGDALDGVAGSPTVRWICHCVGGNQDAARAVAQRVRAALLNKRPAMAGLDSGLIRMESSPPPQRRDESTSEHTWDAIVTYRLGATT